MSDPTFVTTVDEQFLLRAIGVARRAREHGNHPFGALLVTADGRVIEGENGPEPGRRTDHGSPCREVLAAGGSIVHIAGPALLEESAAVHAGFWDQR